MDSRRMPPLTVAGFDAEFDGEQRARARHPVQRVLVRVGGAMADEAARVAVMLMGVLYRLLLRPLAFAVLCCWAAGAAFLAYGRWLDAWVCLVFSVACIAVLAGLRWASSLCTVHGGEGADR